MDFGSVLKDCVCEREINKRQAIEHIIHEHRKREDEDDSFMLFDLGDVFMKYLIWKKALPRVTAFYAVKCNPDVAVLRLLSLLNCGFDCASKGELQLLLQTINVQPRDIIYANTWKQESHLRYAKNHDVKMMTFDSEEELDKINRIHPDAELVLRLSINDPSADFPFGIKFGCQIENVPCLLEKAAKLGLNVIGVSFHIGSGSHKPTLFEFAIGEARKVFDIGAKYGFMMNLLDIGGGFPGKKNIGPNDVKFHEFAEAVNKGLKKHFPDESAVKVIAEPGRFFNESAGTLVTIVHGKRRKTHPHDEHVDEKPGLEGPKLKGFDYFVNNGIFASFARNLIHYGEVMPVPVEEEKLNEPKYESTVYGNTCAEMDYCNQRCKLPELNIGDWIFFEDFGAYHCLNSGTFSGFKPPVKFNYAFTETLSSLIEKLRHENDHLEERPILQEQVEDKLLAVNGVSLGAVLSVGIAAWPWKKIEILH